jgi:hypothetical protein
MLEKLLHYCIPGISTNRGFLFQMSTASEIPKELPGDEADDVLFNSLYGVRTIELNRPKKLNSLNGSMARKIVPRLKVWAKLLYLFASFAEMDGY